MKIAVLGAGIIGSTSAFRLKLIFPGSDLTLISEGFGAETTSHGPAGLIGPHLDPWTPKEKIL